MRNLEEYYYETLLQLHVAKANDNSILIYSIVILITLKNFLRLLISADYY